MALVPNNSRYKALKNTGKLDALRNEEILEGLLEVYQQKYLPCWSLPLPFLILSRMYDGYTWISKSL